MKKAKDNLQMILNDSTDRHYHLTEQFANAVNAGCEALEKQVPIKPAYVGGGNYRCKICKAEIYTCGNYCSHCGRRVDWGN